MSQPTHSQIMTRANTTFLERGHSKPVQRVPKKSHINQSYFFVCVPNSSLAKVKEMLQCDNVRQLNDSQSCYMVTHDQQCTRLRYWSNYILSKHPEVTRCVCLA